MKYLFLILALTACESAPVDRVQVKRDKILSCVKDFRQNEFSEDASFKICGDVYGLTRSPAPAAPTSAK